MSGLLAYEAVVFHRYCVEWMYPVSGLWSFYSLYEQVRLVSLKHHVNFNVLVDSTLSSYLDKCGCFRTGAPKSTIYGGFSNKAREDSRSFEFDTFPFKMSRSPLCVAFPSSGSLQYLRKYLYPFCLVKKHVFTRKHCLQTCPQILFSNIYTIATSKTCLFKSSLRVNN